MDSHMDMDMDMDTDFHTDTTNILLILKGEMKTNDSSILQSISTLSC